MVLSGWLDKLPRHIRIKHRREISVEECEKLIASNINKITEHFPKLPKLQLVKKNPTFVNVWGQCNFCSESSTRRWAHKSNCQSDVLLCVKCSEKLKGGDGRCCVKRGRGTLSTNGEIYEQTPHR